MKFKTIRIKKTSSLVKKYSDREVKETIILLSLFAGAMIIGASIANSDLDITFTEQIFEYYKQKRVNSSLISSIMATECINMAILSILFVFGLGCIGVAPAVLIIVIYGISTGLLAGYLFTQYNMQGIGYYLLTIFPSNIMFVSILIVWCVNTIEMSTNILYLATNKKQENDGKTIKSYATKYLFVILLSFIASALNSILAKAFGVMIEV